MILCLHGAPGGQSGHHACGFEDDDWTPEMAAAREAALEPLPSTKNRCATSKKPSRRRSFGHSGVFEYNGQEGAWMWSDTGSFVQNDPYGDRNKVFDTNRGNYAAPTSSL